MKKLLLAVLTVSALTAVELSADCSTGRCPVRRDRRASCGKCEQSCNIEGEKPCCFTEKVIPGCPDRVIKGTPDRIVRVPAKPCKIVSYSCPVGAMTDENQKDNTVVQSRSTTVQKTVNKKAMKNS